MSTRPRLPRTVRGKRPKFFKADGVDDLHAMILVLAQELVVLRERMDSAEIIAARHGVDLASEIETIELDEPALQRREIWRQAFFDRLFYLSAQRRAELERKHGDEHYTTVLDDIAEN